MKPKVWIYGIIGLWLIISPFIGFSQTFYIVNSLILGIILIAVSYYMPVNKNWHSWIAAIIGAWFIIACFINGLMGGTGLFINNIIFGIIMIVIAYALYAVTFSKNEENPVEEDQDFSNFGAE